MESHVICAVSIISITQPITVVCAMSITTKAATFRKYIWVTFTRLAHKLVLTNYSHTNEQSYFNSEYLCESGKMNFKRKRSKMTWAHCRVIQLYSIYTHTIVNPPLTL